MILKDRVKKWGSEGIRREGGLPQAHMGH